MVDRVRDASGSVRVRTAAAAVLVVGAAVVVAGLTMVVLLQRSLTSDVAASALVRARVAAVALASGQDVAAIPVGNEDEEFVQVLDAQGHVVQASPRRLAAAAVSAYVSSPPSTVRIATRSPRPASRLPSRRSVAAL